MDLMSLKPNDWKGALALWKERYEAGTATTDLGATLRQLQWTKAASVAYEKGIIEYMKDKPALERE